MEPGETRSEKFLDDYGSTDNVGLEIRLNAGNNQKDSGVPTSTFLIHTTKGKPVDLREMAHYLLDHGMDASHPCSDSWTRLNQGL